MEFVYRLPLFAFDPDSLDELDKHRPAILAAIAQSSPDLVRELKKKPFAELDEKLRLKLRKYLLRGRYRPTPFGLLAGVGMGSWGTETQMEYPIQPKPLSSSPPSKAHVKTKKFDPNVNYYPMPGIHRQNGHYHATVYDKQIQRWTECRIPNNSLMDKLLCIGQGDATSIYPPVNLQGFSSLLGIRDTPKRNTQAQNLWKNILNTGLLSPAEPSPCGNATGVDVILANRIDLSEKIKTTLDSFVDSSGNLFAPEDSPYLTTFISWFTGKYDDRFVKLDNLLRERDFVTGKAVTPLHPSSPAQDPIAALLLENGKTGILDLSQHIASTPLPPTIHDLQLLYRLDPTGAPVIENMVCNRAFVYLGRFLRDIKTADHGHAIRETIYGDPNITYAHVELLETDTVNHICNVRNLFAHRISPFPSDGEARIGFQDLWMGIAHNRIVLVHEKTGKQVVPVILHPLNASQITHPVLRLLWETAHQNRHRFLTYQIPTLQNLSHCPQLNWGNLCLQARSWKLRRENHPDSKSLNDRLDSLGAPRHLLAGSLDRELLLDRSHPEDLQILWQELRRQAILTATEAPWHGSKHFTTTDGQALYPQFVHRRSKKLETPKVAHLFNPRSDPQPDALELRIQAHPLDTQEVLERLHVYMNRNRQKPTQWFFMHYGRNGSTEIRLRFLSLCPVQKKRWRARLGGFFAKEGWDWREADYYPEYRKYSNSSLPLSHSLFCMESAFLASPSRHGTYNSQLSPVQKENLIVSLWLVLTEKSPFKGEVFKALQAKVRSLTISETKELKSEFEPMTRNTFLGFPAAHYCTVLQAHSFFTGSTDSAVTLLLNHLHMMCNRFFPEDTQMWEKRVLYRLYRDLGKRMYTRTKPQTALN